MLDCVRATFRESGARGPFQVRQKSCTATCEPHTCVVVLCWEAGSLTWCETASRPLGQVNGFCTTPGCCHQAQAFHPWHFTRGITLPALLSCPSTRALTCCAPPIRPAPPAGLSATIMRNTPIAGANAVYLASPFAPSPLTSNLNPVIPCAPPCPHSLPLRFCPPPSRGTP